MPRSYSMDLRQRVIAACDAGGRTRREIARQFQVSEATLYDWLQRQRAQGSPAPKPHMGGRKSALDKTVLLALVEEANDAILAEYAERLETQTGRRYSVSMLSRVLKELKLSRKGIRYDTSAAAAAVPAPRSISSPRSPLSA